MSKLEDVALRIYCSNRELGLEDSITAAEKFLDAIDRHEGGRNDERYR